MKYLLLLLSLQVTVNGALIWSESFETYDTGIDNLEGQNPAWLTDPVATDSIAVIPTTGFNLPGSYGSKALVVGGIPPVDETTSGIAFVTSPTVASFVPAGQVTEAAFSVDLTFSSGDLDSLTDSFRLTFFDLQYTELATLLFSPSVESGSVSLYRSNTVNTFDVQTSISVDTPITLSLVMNLELNKWSGSIVAAGSTSTLNLFSNVDMTAGTGESNLGGFDLVWLRDGGNWGSNYLVADNMSLTSQIPIPEPSSVLLVFGTLIVGLFRRIR